MSQSKEIKKELETQSAINVIASMEGGKIITKALRKDLIVIIDRLSMGYKTMKYEELLALCADLNAKLNLVRVFNNSKTNKKILEQELEEALKQEGEDL